MNFLLLTTKTKSESTKFPPFLRCFMHFTKLTGHHGLETGLLPTGRSFMGLLKWTDDFQKLSWPKRREKKDPETTHFHIEIERFVSFCADRYMNNFSSSFLHSSHGYQTACRAKNAKVQTAALLSSS